MADFTRLNRIRADIKRLKGKRTELDSRIRELERKCTEEEKTTIHDLVHEARMTPEMLAKIIGMSAGEKIDAINREVKSDESEVENDEDD